MKRRILSQTISGASKRPKWPRDPYRSSLAFEILPTKASDPLDTAFTSPMFDPQASTTGLDDSAARVIHQQTSESGSASERSKAEVVWAGMGRCVCV